MVMLINCPYCSSTNIRARSGGKLAQRYFCLSCSKKFSELTNTHFYRSHLAPHQRELLEKFYREGLGVNQTARYIGVAPYTVCKYFKKFKND